MTETTEALGQDMVKSDEQSDPAPAYKEEHDTAGDVKQETRIPVSSELPASTKENFRIVNDHVIAAFGPLGSFFYFPGSKEHLTWSYVSDQPQKPRIYQELVSWQIGWPYAVALSPHGAGYFAYQPEGRDGVTWRFTNIAQTDRPRARKERKEFDAAITPYVTLKTWLSDNVISADDIKSTRVVFGQGARYMAWKPDGALISNDLPASFSIELQSKKTAAGKRMVPKHVTFGLANAWAVIWPDGSHSVDLDKRYSKLQAKLQSVPDDRILYISLNNCGNLDTYFVNFASVKDSHSLTKSQRTVVQQAWQVEMWNWTKGQNSPLSWSVMDGNDHRRMIITPADASKALAEHDAAQAVAKDSKPVTSTAVHKVVKASPHPQSSKCSVM